MSDRFQYTDGGRSTITAGRLDGRPWVSVAEVGRPVSVVWVREEHAAEIAEALTGDEHGVYHNDPNLVAAAALHERRYDEAMAGIVARDAEITRLRAEVEDSYHRGLARGARWDKVLALESLLELITGREAAYVRGFGGTVARAYLAGPIEREDSP